VAEHHFFNELKSITSGYSTFDYEEIGFEKSDLVRVDVHLNGNSVDALTSVMHRESAQSQCHFLAKKVKDCLHRQLFEISIQVMMNSKSVAKETIKALRKDVTAKCYGGDMSRKTKLLNKQKEGKERMKKIGKVELSSEAFFKLISK
jgi:GTP-binding protein LepA